MNVGRDERPGAAHLDYNPRETMGRTRRLTSLSLALHDIANDRVSRDVPPAFEMTEELPDWTETPGEWGMVNLSGFSRLLFLVINAVTLVFRLKALKPEARTSSGD